MLNYDSERQKGYAGEDAAREYLIEKNYDIITMNFYSRYGEIDIIAREKKTCHIVFVEVKHYKKNSLVDPREMISFTKKKRMIKTAHYFFSLYPVKECQARFDLIIIENQHVKEHLENIIWISQ